MRERWCKYFIELAKKFLNCYPAKTCWPQKICYSLMTMEEGFLRIDNDEIAGQCKNLSNRNSHADSILKVNYSL